MQLDTLLRESWIIWNKRTVKLIIQTFFPFSASIDTVSFLIATTVLLSVLVVAYSLYKLKRKYKSSRQTAERNNDVSEVITVDSKYETLQRKKVTGEVDIHTPGEYMEIDRVKSNRVHGNISYYFWRYRFEHEIVYLKHIDNKYDLRFYDFVSVFSSTFDRN